MLLLKNNKSPEAVEQGVKQLNKALALQDKAATGKLASNSAYCRTSVDMVGRDEDTRRKPPPRDNQSETGSSAEKKHREAKPWKNVIPIPSKEASDDDEAGNAQPKKNPPRNPSRDRKNN